MGHVRSRRSRNGLRATGRLHHRGELLRTSTFASSSCARSIVPARAPSPQCASVTDDDPRGGVFANDHQCRASRRYRVPVNDAPPRRWPHGKHRPRGEPRLQSARRSDRPSHPSPERARTEIREQDCDRADLLLRDRGAIRASGRNGDRSRECAFEGLGEFVRVGKTIRDAFRQCTFDNHRPRFRAVRVDFSRGAGLRHDSREHVERVTARERPRPASTS